MDDNRVSGGTNDLTSMDVVWAVASKTGNDPCSLPPLGETIDPDALDTLLEGRGGESDPRRNGPYVSFTYAGHRITAAKGAVTIRGAE